MNCLLLSAVLVFPALAQESAQPAQGLNQGQGANQAKMPMIKLDGQWTAVYVEMDGRKIENKDFTNVTIKNNVVTCRHEGKEKSWKLEFGPHHMIRSTEMSGSATATSSESGQSSTQGASNTQQGNRAQQGNSTQQGSSTQGGSSKGMHTHHGVYIASQEYFCLSMHKGMDRRGFGAGAGTERNQSGTTGNGTTGREQSTEKNQSGTTGREQGNDRNQAGGAGAYGHFQGQPHGSGLVIILQRSGSSSTTGTGTTR